MQAGKVYFVHLREQMQTVDGLQFKNNNGITFAWKVDEEGRMVIGKPAVCYATDIFVKSEGRRVALDNLNTLDAALVIQKEHLVALATAQLIGAMNFPQALTPKALLAIFDAAAETVENDIVGTMTTRWFEGLLRARFINEGGHVRQALDEVEYMEIQDIIGSGLYYNKLEDTVKTVSVQ